MADETAQQRMARAIGGRRFTTTVPIALEDLRPLGGEIRARRVALEAAHAEMSRAIAKLQRDRDAGEIGPERFERERRAAHERAQVLVRENWGRVREVRERVVTGFERRWNPTSVLLAKAAKDGGYAAFLKSLPDDAREKEIQRLIHARDTEKLALAAVLFEDLRPDIVAAVELKELTDARNSAAAVEREFGIVNAWAETILRGDATPVKAMKELEIQIAAMQRFHATDAEAVDAASVPCTEDSRAQYVRARERIREIEAEVATESQQQGLPSGIDTMKAAFNGGEKK